MFLLQCKGIAEQLRKLADMVEQGRVSVIGINWRVGKQFHCHVEADALPGEFVKEDSNDN